MDQDRERSYWLDFRGECDDKGFPYAVLPIGLKLFGKEITLNNLGEDHWSWRLTKKRAIESRKLELKFKHPNYKFCLKFKADACDFKRSLESWTYTNTGSIGKFTLARILRELTAPPYFQGLYSEAQKYPIGFLPAERIVTFYDKTTTVEEIEVEKDLKTVSTLTLLEEVNRRYKDENPEWAIDLLKGPDNVVKISDVA
jgi:hypothetical protein